MVGYDRMGKNCQALGQCVTLQRQGFKIQPQKTSSLQVKIKTDSKNQDKWLSLTAFKRVGDDRLVQKNSSSHSFC